MPPPDKDTAFRWRREDTQLDLSIAEFVKVVFENDLQVKGPFGGYLYAMKHTTEGEEMLRAPNNPWYLYQARRVWTSGVGGGAVTIRISVPTGVVAKLVSYVCTGSASAGATLQTVTQDEDGATVLNFGLIAAGVSRTVYLPSIGTTSGTHSNIPNSVDLMIGPGTYLTSVCSASLQNETVTVGIALLMSANSEAVWDTTGTVSAGTLAASTISVANTMQLVAMP